MTQGDIVSPTLFNIIVDAVVRYWFHGLEMDETASEGLRHLVRDRNVLFYAEDGLLASRDAEWLQQAFDVLMQAM